MEPQPDECIEHVWRLRNVDFSLLGSTEEYVCTRCGEPRLVTPTY
jgi:hypothetical protein